MKKIIFKITVLALVVGGFTSCDSELDQIPFNEFGTENAYITAGDFENAVRGVYLALVQPSLYGGSDGGSMLDAPDVLADNVTFSQSGRHSRFSMHNWYYSASNASMSSLYYYNYQLIFRANQLLQYLEDFEGNTKSNIEAETRALRALAYFNNVNFFGQIPTQSGGAEGSMGVPYLDEADPLATPARETVGFIYDKVIDDLIFAAANINETNGNGRLSKDAVNTILSRVYLYRGKYQDAARVARLVSAPVADRSSIVDVWEDQSRDGVLFYVENEDAILGLSPGVTWSQGPRSNFRPEYVVSYDFYNSFAADDIRKEAYTLEAGSVNGIKKLFGRPGQSDGKVDIKILRAAEAKLNLAEAEYHNGNHAQALAALDAVRTKRYESAPSGETGAAILEAIKKERNWEFAFEYQRFFDLKRWGMGVERDGHGDQGDGSGTPSEAQNLAAGDHRFQLPISQTALDRNENLVQNPGY